VKLRYGTQISTAPPTFLFFANLPKALPDHYIRYIHNSLRERWGFVGSPVRIRFKEN
jgi:GTP-binding protein